MAKFIKYSNGNKYVSYINLDNVTEIRERGNATEVYFVGEAQNFGIFDMPISEFMDLVNSAE